ncbi:MAG: class I SAM-dependent methyltransferase [Flavobacteriaceae bacterium]|nr:class I SAM-dependent methyltransferase [Flavobacteriaceae bacterium]
MNQEILNKEVQNFINSNLKSDVTKLILKGSPFPYVSIQEIAAQILAKNSCEKKLPIWFNSEKIYYPNKLNIEQTSSEITAKYKSDLVSGNTLIDITGGFGVDAYFFSQKFESVIHCEINKELSAIAAHNFNYSKAKNIKIHLGDGIEFLAEHSEKFDWIYADPSRRNDAKGKVFLLEDCLPNIPENLNLLFEKTDNILLKVSPILDITSALNELQFVKEIHVVAVENEVKELLFLLEKNYTKNIQVKTTNIAKNSTQKFDFILDESSTATFSEPKKYVYEPNAAILKSGAFLQVSEKLNIAKLHQSSHLYTSSHLIDFPGRRFEIKHCISYGKKQLLQLIPSKKANITTRNFPETVAQIRKKTGLKDGGNEYLFFTTDINNKHLVLICEKV